MIDENLLTELADAPVRGGLRPLSEIETRARRIRGVRRVRTVVATSVAACGVAVAAVTVSPLLASPGAPSPQPGASSATGIDSAKGSKREACDGGYGHQLTVQQIPDLLYLPSASVSGPIIGDALARDSEAACDPPTARGTWYALAEGKVTRRLAIEGPDSRNRYGPTFEGTVQKVDVRGVTGLLYPARDRPESWLFWTAEDGGRWGVDATGLARDQLVAAVNSLQIEGDRVDTSRAPVGLDRLAPPGPGAAQTRHNPYFHARFGSPDDDGWTLEVRKPSASNDGMFAGRMVDVGGATGWWEFEPSTAHGNLSWHAPGGVRIFISGRLTLDQALRAARSVVKVSPDDPRLVAAREPVTKKR